jgi:hypothetical protein
MKQFINKLILWVRSNKSLSIIIAILLVISVVLFSQNQDLKYSKNDVSKEVVKPFLEKDISSASEITCTYPQILNTSYFNDEITHSLPKPETNPIIITFSKLDEEVGQLSSIDSTQTISTFKIVKISEDDEKIIYIEKSNDNYLSTYTIYKKLGVSVYTKTVSLLGIPSGSLATGSCVGY